MNNSHRSLLGQRYNSLESQSKPPRPLAAQPMSAVQRNPKLMQDLAFLSSSETQGRLSGTSGARIAADYLANALRNAGVSPAGDDAYSTSVSVSAARLTGAAQLRIGGTELKHRIDFAEWLPFSAGGSITGKLITVTDDQVVKPEALKGNVVLIPSRPEGFDIEGTIQSALAFGVSALLIEYGEPRSFHKTVFGSNKSKIPVMRIKKSTAEQFADKNVIVELELPLETDHLPCHNVIGFLPGLDKSKTLLLSAHYDHLGDDPEGLRFPGTIDNGSGVAVMLEVARRLAEQPGKVPVNILIAFLTEEESGMWGARQLASHPPWPISAAINLDGLGFEEELFAMRTGHKSSDSSIVQLAERVIARRGIEVKRIAGGDDSAAFIEKGIPTIGLGQKPTLQSSIPIHTTEDNIDHIHVKPIMLGLEVVEELIQERSALENWS